MAWQDNKNLHDDKHRVKKSFDIYGKSVNNTEKKSLKRKINAKEGTHADILLMISSQSIPVVYSYSIVSFVCIVFGPLTSE